MESQPMDFHIEVYQEKEKFPYIRHVQEYAYKTGILKTDDEILGVAIKGVGKSFDLNSFQGSLIKGKFIQFPDSG